MSGYVKTFKVEDKNSELLSFSIDNEKLSEKYKAIWNKIKDIKNIKLNAFTGYDDRYIKTKRRTYDDKVYNNFRGLSVLQDDIEYISLTDISMVSLLVYENKYYLQLYLHNSAYKIINKQMTDYLEENLFEDSIL